MEEPYVLFDIPEGDDPPDREFLEGLGHRVVVCNGPSSEHPCPILDGEVCQLVAGAHGVIFGLDLDRSQNRAVLARYRSSLGKDTPVRVITRPEQAERNAPLLEGFEVRTVPRGDEIEPEAD